MIVVFSLLVLPFLACSSLAPTPDPTGTPTPTDVLPAVTLPPPLVSTTASTFTPMPTEAPPTPTVVSAVCPAPASPEMVKPAELSRYPDAIREYLSAGGNLERLRAKLADWGALPDAEDQVIAVDLTGDRANEVILAVADPSVPMISPPGLLLIFGCSEGAYIQLYGERSGEEETFNPAIQLVQIGDLNLDDLPDLLYVLKTCGAHTCYERLKILSWDGAQFANLMGGTLELPYPSYTVEPGRVEAKSGGIGSAGAEPQRGYSEVWEWNGDVFTITGEIYEPPVFRYHALLDGDCALRSGDYLTATEIYQRVLGDDELREWGAESGMMTPTEERARLTAFARWRLVLTYVLTGRIDDAQGVYGRLQEEYPAGAVGNDVAEMAETFWEAYLQDESVTEGCSKVIAVAEEYASVLGFFNQNYGYANPWWEPRDLCPFIH